MSWAATVACSHAALNALHMIWSQNWIVVTFLASTATTPGRSRRAGAWSVTGSAQADAVIARTRHTVPNIRVFMVCASGQAISVYPISPA